MRTDDVNHTYFIQQGSHPELRTSDDSKWYVVHEVWLGQIKVSASIVSRHDTEAEAKKALKNIK
jgi:hypothetical protein